MISEVLTNGITRQVCGSNIAVSRLLTNQSQHFPAPLKARPPDRIVSGRIVLYPKRGIVRQQCAYGFDAAAAEHRPVRSVDRAGRNRTRQRRESVFSFD